MKRIAQFILSALLSFAGLSQSDYFSDYRAQVAEGEMPEDFEKLTFEKVSDENNVMIDGLSKKKSQEFVKGIHYSIDEILKSGRVLYGDPMTKYVSRVGDKIIKNDPALADVRFYTLRSNIVNAFSTKQGIIFVTQGLLAQVANEAQLAFVLAHEIAHYKQDHVIQGYKENIELAKHRSSHESKIKSLSTYSKEKEYEADGIGVELYHQAGYSKEELIDVYDVLTYSYLPFDLKTLPKDYWNTDHLFIPPSFFVSDIPEISIDLDYDDSKSSHPNIKSRSEQVIDIVANMAGWKNNVFLLPEEDFHFAQTIARFETVRNDLFNFRYGDALYSIFLLEQDFPDNIYLERCKAQAWAGLLAFKIEGRFNSVTTSPSKVQGDPHQLHQLLRKFNKKQLLTVALRQIADIHTKYPNDAEVNAIYRYAIDNLAKEKQFKISEYSELSYTQALEEFNNSLNELIAQEADTTSMEETETKELSKYEKIKRNKETKTKAVSAEDEFNQDEFHIYALADVLKSDMFDQLFSEAKKKLHEQEKLEEQFNDMSYSERAKAKKKANQEIMMIGANEIILLEPRAMKVKGNSIDVEKSEKLEIDLREVVERFKGTAKVSVYKVGALEYKQHGTYMYNQKAALANSLSHLIEYETFNVFPVDYARNQEIINDFGTNKVAFIFIQSVTKTMTPLKIVSYSIFPPVWLIGGPLTFFKSFYTNFGVVLFDIEKYEFDGMSLQNIAGMTSKIEMEALLYDFLIQINQTKSNN